MEIATEGDQNGSISNTREKALLQQIKLLKEEREHSHVSHSGSLYYTEYVLGPLQWKQSL